MKLLVTAAAASLVATQAFAGTWEVRCTTETVPYQESLGGTPEEVLGGAIIGGLLGGAATDDNAGAVVGAIIGGALANEGGGMITSYREVETCSNVFIPDRITDVDFLEDVLRDLNAGRSVNRELTMDVQYTIGVGYDGVWGRKSRAAAEQYLASLEPAVDEEEVGGPLYSLVVNNVVIVSSTDVSAIDEIKKALFQAGVDASIFVDLR